MMLYNREPVLPIDVKHNLVNESEQNNDETFDFEVFNAVLKSAGAIRDSIADEASKKIKSAQKKQMRDYD